MAIRAKTPLIPKRKVVSSLNTLNQVRLETHPCIPQKKPTPFLETFLHKIIITNQ